MVALPVSPVFTGVLPAFVINNKAFCVQNSDCCQKCYLDGRTCSRSNHFCEGNGRTPLKSALFLSMAHEEHSSRLTASKRTR